MFRLSALLLLPLALPCQAANWNQTGSSSSGDVWYVDSESIKEVSESYNGLARKAWVRLDFSQNPKEAAREAKVLFFFKCNEEQARSTTWVYYKPDGTVLRDISESSSTYSPVIPETVLATAMQFVCAQTK